MTKRVKPLVTEIANIDYAINSGLDGIILKEEMTMAQNYVDIVKVLKNILNQIEDFSDCRSKYEELSKFFTIHNENGNLKSLKRLNVESLFDCSVKTAYDVNVGLIILHTDDFNNAKCMSKFRPKCNIICATEDEKSIAYLRLVRGVTPYYLDKNNFLMTNINKTNKKELHEHILKMAKEMNLYCPLKGQLVLVVNSFNKKDLVSKNGMYFI
jgi:pyruvate kinase